MKSTGKEYEFFYRATVAVCRHLEAEDALRACVQLLAEYMPVERMYLDVWGAELDTVTTIATATAEVGTAMNRLVNYPKSSDRPVEQLVDEQHEANVFRSNDPAQYSWFVDALTALGRPADRPIIGTYPMVDGQIVGAVVAIAPQGTSYSSAHEKLFAMLKSPFGIIIKNTMHHRKLQQFSDALADDNRYLQRELQRGAGEKIIGADFGLADVMRAAQQVAVHDSPVLLLGETGVGKDVIANHIHQTSERNQGPFIKINCGAIPDSLIDSELFGHEKGAFTGALTQKRGRFERANKGTIFLDEVGELPPQAQVRLLRVLQNQEIERIGGDTTITLDIRIIAATHRNLEKMVKTGKFREDLWFRLNVFPINIPPLRARVNDIPALVQHFLTEKSKELKYETPPELSRDDLDEFIRYTWPGNVREVENVVERALILGNGEKLALRGLLAQAVTPSSVKANTATLQSLDDVISSHIKTVLQHTDGKIHGKDGAAAILGLNTSTLRSRMDKLGISYRKR